MKKSLLAVILAVLGAVITACGGGDPKPEYPPGQAVQAESINFEERQKAAVCWFTCGGEVYIFPMWDGSINAMGNISYNEVVQGDGGFTFNTTSNGRSLFISYPNGTWNALTYNPTTTALRQWSSTGDDITNFLGSGATFHVITP